MNYGSVFDKANVIFLLVQIFQTGFDAHPAAYSMTERSYPSSARLKRPEADVSNKL
jgi:hypothetical protein